jgi:hypothetical protein
MLRALISISLLVGGSSLAFAEGPATAPARTENVVKAEKAEKPTKKHHKANKARKKPNTPKKHHKHHSKKK